MAQPPWNVIIQKIPTAQTKLERIFWRILAKLAKISAAIALASAGLPENIRCSDPRVIRIKEMLLQFQKTLQEFIKYLGYISITASVLYIIAQAATAYLIYTQANPVPLPTAVHNVISAQGELLNTILDILKKYSPLFALFTANIIAASVMITPAVNLISQICKDVIPINKYTEAAIQKTKDLATQVEGVANSNSRFYQDVNVSESDIESRQRVIDQLLSQQRSLTELIEAPSGVYLVTGQPESDTGKLGDYALDQTNRIIYGPKLTDTTWNEGIKY
jgi:hypothetical protein